MKALDGGEANPERGAGTRPAANADFAVVRLDGPSRDGKPQAGAHLVAIIATGSGFVDAVKALEDFRSMLRRNPGTRVRDGQAPRT